MVPAAFAFDVVPVGSPELYNLVRSKLAAEGNNLNAWCRQRGLNRSFVAASLKGQRHGKGSEGVRREVMSVLLAGRLVA